jgi:hypothetical protein
MESAYQVAQNGAKILHLRKNINSYFRREQNSSAAYSIPSPAHAMYPLLTYFRLPTHTGTITLRSNTTKRHPGIKISGLAIHRSILLKALYYYYYYYYLTAIGLTPGGSSIHLHTNSTQNTEDGTHITITMGKNYKEKTGK